MTIKNYVSMFRECCEHRVLIATPFLNGTYFEHSLIYVCAHDQGAVGVVFNKEMAIVKSEDIIEASNNRIAKSIMQKQYSVVIGGPLQENSVSFLYLEPQEGSKKAKNVAVLYTEAEQFIKALQKTKKKAKFLVVRGITSWAPGQLESELQENSWIVADPDYNLIFSRKRKDKDKWKIMVESIGLKNKLTNIVGYCGMA